VSVLDSHEPVAGQQGFLRLTVQAKRFLGKMQIDLFTIVSADDAQGSQAVEPADEMDNLLNDITKSLTRYAFIGGGGLQGVDSITPVGAPIGVIWQRSNAITQYGYRGRFDDVIATAPQARNFARFIRLDTYAQVGVDTLITALTNRTITLAANIDTSTLPVGVPCAVLLVGAASQAFAVTFIQGTNTAGDPVVEVVGGQEVGAMVGDMTGFISNLTQPLHFGQNRNSVDPRVRRLRSNFMVVNNTNALGGDTLNSLDFLKLSSRARTISGEVFDAWWMSWETMVAYPQAYVGISDGNVRVNPNEKSSNQDAHPSQPAKGNPRTPYSAAGVPLYCSEQCPDGMAIGMLYEGWERLFKGPQEGVWVGANGPGTSPLIKTQGETQYTATRAMFPEQVCIKPHAQGLLVGIADPA